jgi:uncharacterized protein YndB with AHSA1/START domain
MIEKDVLLRCTPDRAFALFTAEASRWWPPTRRHTGDPESRITMAATGRFCEESAERQVELGRVVDWCPPERLVLEWFPGTGPEQPTRVEVTFEPEGPCTRVRVRHGPTPASEAIFPTRAPRYAESWELVLAALASAS